MLFRSGVQIAEFGAGTRITPDLARVARGIAQVGSMALANAALVGELEHASQLKSEFVSTMSHELRTPLNVILGYAEMAREGDSSLSAHEIMARIELSGRDLLGLIESTLEIGEIEAGRDAPRVEEVAFETFWTALGEGCERLPRREGVAFEWRNDVPGLRLATDPRKLTVIVRNLVGNALKFTERGAVRVAAQRDGDTVVLTVADTGIGIRREDHAAVFEMFRQADGSDSRRFNGSGLGLYIVRRLVEQLGGTVALTSALGQGSVFLIVLPRSPAAQYEPRAA